MVSDERVETSVVQDRRGCRAPHCWSEYGTPCGTCPVEKSETPFFTGQQERMLDRCEAFDAANPDPETDT